MGGAWSRPDALALQGVACIVALAYVVSTHTVLVAGMTVKFFSLWFIEELTLRPVYVSTLSALAPVGISLASILSQRVSARWVALSHALCARDRECCCPNDPVHAISVALIAWMLV